MKKKLVAILGVAAMLVMIAGGTGAFAQDKGPAHPTLNYNGKSKKVANFPHHDHQARIGDCQVCHHKDKAGETPRACKSCHGDKADGAKPKMKDAMHKRCKGCHKKEKHGPTKCKGCHGRK